MSYPEIEGKPSITILKSHELIQIFGYLDCANLLSCRLVCPYWHQLINDEPRLCDNFRISLSVNSGTLISAEVFPFSMALKNGFKCKFLAIQEDFVDPGNNIAVVAANEARIAALSTVLAEMRSLETVTEISVQARDDDIQTSALLFKLIMKMTNMKVLRFTMTAFVHMLDFQLQNTRLEHVQILHTDLKRLIVADFERLLNIFPNINRIDLKPSETMLLGKNILVRFAPLFRSLENLEEYTLSDLEDTEDLFLSHISYSCSMHEYDVNYLNAFLENHHEIATMSLRFRYANYLSKFFNKEFPQIIDLDILESVKASRDRNRSRLYNILRYTPNLQRLSVKFKRAKEHFFAHKSIEMKQLVHVAMIRFHLNCMNCCTTMLKSLVHVKSLKLAPHNCAVSLAHMAAIAQNLEKLESLELVYDDDVGHGNYFQDWPSMPNLKKLIINRVGYVTSQGIINLREKCPKLEVLKCYSIRGSIIENLLKLTLNTFPNMEAITFRGGRPAQINELNYIDGKVGWNLRELDISADIKSDAILDLFKYNDLLETIRCNYGSLVVTRRIYFEVRVLQAYDLKSMEQPLKNRRRLHLQEDTSSDSETSNSELSSESSSNEDDVSESG